MTTTENTAVETAESVREQLVALKDTVRRVANYHVANGSLNRRIANAGLGALGVDKLTSYRFYEVAVPVEQVLVLPYRTRGESEATVAEKLQQKLDYDVNRMARGVSPSRGVLKTRPVEGFNIAEAMEQVDSEDGSDVETLPVLATLQGTFTDELAQAKAELELFDANVRRVLIWLCRDHGLCGSGVQGAADEIGLVGFNAQPKSVEVRVPASGYVTTSVRVFDGEDAATVAAEQVTGHNELGARLAMGRFIPENIQGDAAAVVEPTA